MNGRVSRKTAFKILGWHVQLTLIYRFLWISQYFLRYLVVFFALSLVLLAFSMPLCALASLFFGCGCYELVPAYNRKIFQIADEMDYFVMKSNQFMYIQRNRHLTPSYRRYLKMIDTLIHKLQNQKGI